MRLRSCAYLVVARAAQRFAPTGLGVSRAPEDTQAHHYQKNRSDSFASPCRYCGCLYKHPGCPSRWQTTLSAVRLDALVEFTDIVLPPYAYVQSWLRMPQRSAAPTYPGGHVLLRCTLRRQRAASVRFGSGPVWSPFRPTLRKRCRSIRRPRQSLDAEWGLFDDTRQTVSPTSSAISNPPVRSTARPTGLPRA
jgi:hypothetical protein